MCTCIYIYIYKIYTYNIERDMLIPHIILTLSITYVRYLICVATGVRHMRRAPLDT